MSRAGTLALVVAAQAACVPAIDYEGRRCYPNQPCPSGYVCWSDERCHRTSEDAGASDAALGDAGFAWNPARCTDPLHYPTGGWEARHYRLPSDMTLDEQYCLGVEDVPGRYIARDYGFGGLADGLVIFGTKWTGTRTATIGSYVFSVDHDDGIRIFLDELKVYDHYSGPHATATATITRDLAARDYKFTVDYYNSAGEAKIFVSWASACTGIDSTTMSWVLAYHRTDGNGVIDESGCLSAEVRTDRTLSLSWSDAPALIRGTGLRKDFAIIGKTRRVFAGPTTFALAHTDAMRLTIDGQTMLYDRRGPGPRRTATVSANLNGVHDLEFEMVDLSGAGSVSISW